MTSTGKKKQENEWIYPCQSLNPYPVLYTHLKKDSFGGSDWGFIPGCKIFLQIKSSAISAQAAGRFQ
jgi:hypothetical protein